MEAVMKTSTSAARTVILCRGTAPTHAVSDTIRLNTARADSDPLKAPQPRLTQRQLEVLSLLCEGLPNKLICRRLDIASGTVKVHISSIFRELGVSSRLQAVVVARRMGLLQDLENAGPQHLLPPLLVGAGRAPMLDLTRPTA
jgi:DNA-binding NarL/FixJ family response regulator